MTAFQFRRRRTRRLWMIGTTTALLSAALLVFVVSAGAVLPGSPSKFESGNDPTLGLGNMIVDDVAAGNNDWATVSFTDLTDPAADNGDDSFEPGSKQDTTCPVIEGHKNPPKDDFTDIASYIEENTTATSPFFGDTYLYGATIRYAANGNASENIELNQGTGPLCPGSTLESRVAGDRLIAIDYLGGGNAVEFHVLTWVISGACNVGNHTAPCWGATVLTLDPNEAEGGVSNVDISAANNPISGVDLKAGQFAEFGINLSEAGIVDNTTCVGFTQIVWESRSAGSSFVSSTKDIKVQPVNINQCASVSVIKLGSDGGSQAGATFTLYEGTGTGGTVVGSCTVQADTTCSDPSFSGLNPGTYTFDETGNIPAGYTKDADLPDTFTLGDGQTLVLTYTNVLQTGAIKVAKTAKHADSGSSPDLAAGFTVTDSGGATHAVSTDATGSGCVDGLPPGSATVSETGPPAGYSAGPDATVTVAGGSTCTGADGVLASFENIPLTDITVSVDSQVDGGTSSTITCGDEDTVTTEANGDGSTTLSDLEPNDPDGIICTIVIDP